MFKPSRYTYLRLINLCQLSTILFCLLPVHKMADRREHKYMYHLSRNLCCFLFTASAITVFSVFFVTVTTLLVMCDDNNCTNRATDQSKTLLYESLKQCRISKGDLNEVLWINSCTVNEMSVSRCVSCKGHVFSHACQVKTQQCLHSVTTGKWATPVCPSYGLWLDQDFRYQDEHIT